VEARHAAALEAAVKRVQEVEAQLEEVLVSSDAENYTVTEVGGAVAAQPVAVPAQPQERRDARTATLNIDVKLQELERRRRMREHVARAEIARAGMRITFSHQDDSDSLGGSPQSRVVTAEDSATAREILASMRAGSDDEDAAVVGSPRLLTTSERYAQLHPASRYVSPRGRAERRDRGAHEEQGGGGSGRTRSGSGGGGSPSIYERYKAQHPAGRYLADSSDSDD
jgi:hypothetical protein